MRAGGSAVVELALFRAFWFSAREWGGACGMNEIRRGRGPARGQKMALFRAFLVFGAGATVGGTVWYRLAVIRCGVVVMGLVAGGRSIQPSVSRVGGRYGRSIDASD